MSETRTLEQNDYLWSLLRDISKQVPWPVNGTNQLLEPEDWKDILSAGLKQDQRIAAGINGGWVMLGVRTKKMTIKQMSELLEFIQWFGADKDVKWTKESPWPTT
jgi:phage-related protein